MAALERKNMTRKTLSSPIAFTADLLKDMDKPRVRCQRVSEGNWKFNYSLIHPELPDLAERLETWLQLFSQSISPLRIKSVEITLDCNPSILNRKVDTDCDADAAFREFSAACAENLSQLNTTRSPVTIHIIIGLIMNDVELGTDWDLDLDPAREAVHKSFDELLEKLTSWKAGQNSCWLTLEWLRPEQELPIAHST